MKRSKLITVVFLLLLYIGPMILISSGILTEPNMTKDFSLSTEYETSDESITSFGETLPDDILFYPDSDNTLVQNEWDDWDTDSGSLAIKYNDYNATKTNTTTEYDPSASGGIQPSDSFVMAWGYRFQSNTVNVQFNFTLPSVYTSLTLNTIMSGSADSNTLATSNNGSLDGGWYIRVWNWNTSSYVQLDYKNSGLTWGYSTALDIDNADYFDSATRTVMIKYSVYASDLYVGIWIYSSSITLGWTDYAESYAESFADVSDWALKAGTDSFSTDGDVVTIKAHAESDDDYEGIETTGLSIPIDSSTRLEWRDKCNDTIADYVQIRLYGGSDFYYKSPGDETNWRTLAYTIKAMSLSGSDFDTIDKIVIFVRLDETLNISLSLDYLQIGPADKMGWQHDGSTTAGTEEEARSGWSYSISSDNDLLTMTFSRSGGVSTYGSVYLNFDTTATEADLETTYYPFLGLTWECSALTANDFYVIPCIDGKTNVDDAELVGGQKFTSTFSQATHRINTAALSGSTGTIGLRFIVRGDDTESATLKVDWAKAYSIANFTVTQSGVTSEDYLYVDSGVLYSNIDSGYIETNHDPALSVVIKVSGLWALTTSSGTPESDYYVSAWAGYSSETEGSLANGNLTDLKLKFTDAANVAAITFFIAPPQWYESGDVGIMFQTGWTPEFQFGYDAFFIFLGLIMIPVSTMYLAKGGRKEMTRDKLFIGLVIFVMGIGLLIGGIIP